MLYFSSDLHLYHHNVLKYANRLFKDVREMHKEFVKNHNAIVNEDDEFWFLGDLCIASPEFVGKMRKIVDSMNGVKHIVLGNHDDWKARSYLNAGFTTAHTAAWLYHEGLKFYMMHDPAEYAVVEKEENAVLLCGHIHQLFKHLLPGKRVINVGLDVWDYKPVSIEQIVELLKEHDVFSGAIP